MHIAQRILQVAQIDKSRATFTFYMLSFLHFRISALSWLIPVHPSHRSLTKLRKNLAEPTVLPILSSPDLKNAANIVNILTTISTFQITPHYNEYIINSRVILNTAKDHKGPQRAVVVVELQRTSRLREDRTGPQKTARSLNSSSLMD